MNQFTKRLILLIALIAGISTGVIYMTIDAETLLHLNVFKPWSLLGAILCIAVGMYFDGSRLMHLVWISGERITLSQAVQVIFSNYFLALLTPGAAGGAFAQVMFLRRAGVTTGKATVLVLVRTILSILFLFVCLPVVFYFDSGLVPWFSPRGLIFGSLIMIGGIFAGIWLFRTPWPKRILVLLTKKMQHRRRRKIFLLYAEMRGAVSLLSSSPGSMLRVFGESALSLLALYSIVPVLLLGMGIGVDWGQLLGRMVFLNLFLYFAPTPGGAGIAEGGFILLFNEFLPAGTVGIVAVAWRILAEYLPFSIGFYYTVKVFGRDFLAKLDKRGSIH